MDTPKKIGRYEILGELGHGAMGTVYRAKDPSMDRVVAVKTIISLALASDQVGDFRERFYREARAAGALTHPGIVPVFDVGEHEGVPFLVMEFISGKTLDDTIKRGQRMTLDRVCEIGQKLADALGYAHQHGVVHRDIKPANILLTSRESHGIERPKITDFGVAKLAAGHDPHRTHCGDAGLHASGTNHRVTNRWARGPLFSWSGDLLDGDGEKPFPGESITAVSYKVVHTEPVPPRKLNPSIPIKLENIILKCLAKNPDERYQTGEELARELGELWSVSTSMGSKNASTGPVAEGHDPNETLVETLTAAKAEQNATARVPQVVAPPAVNATSPPQGKSSKLPVLVAIAVVAIAAVGWFVSHRSEKPLSPATAPDRTRPSKE